jgi:hypothetical protein
MNNSLTDKIIPATIFRLLLFFTILLTLFSSCKIKKSITATRSEHIAKKSAKELETLLKKNEFKFESISAKFSTDLVLDSSQTSFNVTLRGRRDSALWFSITVPLIGIEAARAIVTKDSVKFIDRIHSEYFKGDFNYINKLLHADLDFEMLQSLLIGNSVDFYDDDDRLHSATNDGRYLLSTIRKRKLRRVMQHNKELKDPAQSIWLDPATFKIARILFNDFNQNRTFNADFDKFDKIDSSLFPFNIYYNIKAQKNVDIKIEYSKVTINTPQTFPFSIPSKYERIVYKEK